MLKQKTFEFIMQNPAYLRTHYFINILDWNECRWALNKYIRDLPLFPLNTVLFPGGTIPLQVFENRYIKMINDCLDSDSNFGIVLIKEGNVVGGPSIPRSVGTIAKITSINQIPNDRLLVN